MSERPRVSLTPGEKYTLRTIILRHGADPSLMSTSQLLASANDLGIDPSQYLGAKNEESAPKPAPVEIRTAVPSPPVPQSETTVTNTSPQPVQVPAKAGDALAQLIAQIAGQSLSEDRVRDIATEQVAKSIQASVPALRIECKGFDGVLREAEGHTHQSFRKLLLAATSRQTNGFSPGIWLAGPTGSGKSHAAKQLCGILGVEFHENGALSDDYKLLGYIHPTSGEYVSTPFRQAYEFGGGYMFDEVDASDNRVLLALNSALAGSACTFPDKVVERHPNFICMASANTWGLGGTSDFVGRARIDAAFLSRFPVRIFWDYDVKLELAISGNEEFAQRVIEARMRARTSGLKVIIDPRASMAGSALIANGATGDEAADLTYLANLTADQRNIVEGS